MPNDILDFIALSLACYRLSLMVSKESGPFWAFKHLRRLIKREAPKKSHMDDGVSCTFCLSMQFGIVLAVSAYYWWGNPVYQLTILALDLSAVAVICNQLFTRGKL